MERSICLAWGASGWLAGENEGLALEDQAGTGGGREGEGPEVSIPLGKKKKELLKLGKPSPGWIWAPSPSSLSQVQHILANLCKNLLQILGLETHQRSLRFNNIHTRRLPSNIHTSRVTALVHVSR